MDTYEALGLDLIMNAQKRAKKQDTETARSHALNKLHKAFQILQQRVLSSPCACSNIDSFINHFEEANKDLVASFEAKFFS